MRTSLDAVKGTLRRMALEGHAPTSSTVARRCYDFAGKCETPVIVEYDGEPTNALGQRYETLGPGRFALQCDFVVPCRKCPTCRANRTAMWVHRAVCEAEIAPRTWFGTLTLSPEHQFQLLCRARLKCDRQGDDFDALEAEARFLKLSSEFVLEIQRYLKRLRKNTGSSFRYLYAIEAHKSGVPHGHILLHEWEPSKPVPKRALEAAYTLGFTQWRLVDHGSNAIRYVCKYLYKCSNARVRASLHYGDPTSVLARRKSQRETLTIEDNKSIDTVLELEGECDGTAIPF